MENKDTNKYKVKVLKTSYERCVPERLDKLKTEYDLIIRSIKMPAKEIDSYGDYAKVFEDLSQEKRTVYFYSIPVKLSKTQFAILFLLLRESGLQESDYKEIVDKLNRKNNKKALTSNFKSFITRFKSKFKKNIKTSENILVEKSKNEILVEIDNLLYYKLEFNEYTVRTKFCIQAKCNVKKCNN